MPAGRRVYAIGDVHGRLDCLRDLLGRIARDDAARPAAATEIVLLGDLVDRGPDSAALIEYLRAFRPAFARFHFVMGNHEEAMLAALDGPDADAHANGWLGFGGAETLASYGMPRRLLGLPGRALALAARDHIPRAHLDFLRGFADSVAIGDYLFVHAGIRPGIAIARQKPADLRWIRDPFLADTRDHGVVVVHGHTITATPDLRDNRIGIDTGAWRTGVLTALGLEGDERWVLATEAD